MGDNLPEHLRGEMAQPSKAAVESHLHQVPDTSQKLPDDIAEDDYVGIVHGDDGSDEFVMAPLRTDYKPWHHPIKQIVRQRQWVESAKRLIESHRSAERRDKLRYFTLPGADLFDVRVLADSLVEAGTRIEYFGFDSGYEGDGEVAANGAKSAYLAAESALRQADRITEDAVILKDRLEDIAQDESLAATMLDRQGVFDIINMDACDHLGYVPKNRKASMFDALEKLLKHQMIAKEPWLLFVTTRADVDLLGVPARKFQTAIGKNIDQHNDAFAKPLSECIDAQLHNLTSAMNGCWSNQDINFLRLFCIGLGKYLLHFYHAQINLPAGVELVSAYAYKVHRDEPDMLSLAFRITPKGIQAQAPNTGGAIVVPNVELQDAVAIVARAKKLWNLDQAIEDQTDLRNEVVTGTEKLLRSAGFDIPGWQRWLGEHRIRPLDLNVGS